MTDRDSEHAVVPDKYHAPQWLGNRAERRFHVMVKPARSARNLDCTYCFCRSKQTLPGYCRPCEFPSDCWGECPRNRLLHSPDGEPGLNYLCSGLKRFFLHAVPAAKRLAAELGAAPSAPRARMLRRDRW
jgi:uncharacterized protein